MPKKRKPESRPKTNPRAQSSRRGSARTATREGTSLLKGVVVASAIGGTFALGLSFGQGEPRGELDDAKGTLLAIADEQTNRYEAVKSSLKLTFHETLTAPVALALPPPDARPSSKKAAPSSPPPQAEPSHARAAASTKEPAPIAPHQPSAPREVEERPVDVAREDAPSVDATDEGDDDDARRARLAKALARLHDGDARDAHEDKREAPRVAEATSSPARYVVQVASSPSEENARALADKLRASGRRVRVVAAEVEGQGTMYRVQVTGFSSSEAANAAQKDLADDGVRGLVRQDT